MVSLPFREETTCVTRSGAYTKFGTGSQDPSDADAFAFEPRNCAREVRRARVALLVRQHFCVRETRGVVDRDVDDVPPGSASAPPAVPSDPVTVETGNAAQLLHLEMQQLAGMAARVTLGWRLIVERLQPI